MNDNVEYYIKCRKCGLESRKFKSQRSLFKWWNKRDYNKQIKELERKLSFVTENFVTESCNTCEYSVYHPNESPYRQNTCSSTPKNGYKCWKCRTGPRKKE